MEFARQQLKKYGWSEGDGLGRQQDGIVEPLRPRLKFDTAGIGHNAADELTNSWWSEAFNRAAKNVKIGGDNGGSPWDRRKKRKRGVGKGTLDDTQDYAEVGKQEKRSEDNEEVLKLDVEEDDKLKRKKRRELKDVETRLGENAESCDQGVKHEEGRRKNLPEMDKACNVLKGKRKKKKKQADGNEKSVISGSVEEETRDELVSVRRRTVTYANFQSGGVLRSDGTIQRSGVSAAPADPVDSRAGQLSDHQLLLACGGRTAHKGARHGHRMSGKLARLQAQESGLLAGLVQQHQPRPTCPEKHDNRSVLSDVQTGVDVVKENSATTERKRRKSSQKHEVCNELASGRRIDVAMECSSVAYGTGEKSHKKKKKSKATYGTVLVTKDL